MTEPEQYEDLREPLTLKEKLVSAVFLLVVWGGFVALIYFDIAPVIGVGPFAGSWVGALVIVCLAAGAFGVLVSFVQGRGERRKH